MPKLSPRQESILTRVVDAHIETAQPVGSEHISRLYRRLYRDTYSPATVRHEMGSLEEMGYLTHPHTSAGRVPTDLGYRYYVAHGLHDEVWPEAFFQNLGGDWARNDAESGWYAFADEASRQLSNLSGEIGLAVCGGLRPAPAVKRSQLFLRGSSHLLKKPEFRDLEKTRLLLETLEEKPLITDWLLRRQPEAGVSVTIGRENPQDAFWECSVISAHYRFRGERAGTIALIGPRRMRYSRMIPLVGQMTRCVERMLDRIEF